MVLDFKQGDPAWYTKYKIYSYKSFSKYISDFVFSSNRWSDYPNAHCNFCTEVTADESTPKNGLCLFIVMSLLKNYLVSTQ